MKTIKSTKYMLRISVVPLVALLFFVAPAVCVAVNMLPVVSTQPATGVTASGATLNGSVNPNGTAALYIFKYGLTTSYGSYAGTNFLASGTSPVAVNIAVSGLLPGTLYHYQLMAINSFGTGTGSDMTFTTATATPTATVSGGGTIFSGGSTNIQATLTGVSPWTVTWSDGFVQSGVTASPATRSVSPTVTTTYTVTALADATGLPAGTLSGSATVTVNPVNSINVYVDPSKSWIGYMNVFDLPANGGGYELGSAWGTADLDAVFSESTLTLTPNTSIDRDAPNDPYWWVGGSGGAPNKNMDAAIFVQDDTLAGQSVTFSGNIQANTLVAPYTSTIFIKDFAFNYSSYTTVTIPMVAGAFSITKATAAGDHIQYGFETIGPDARGATVASLGSVVITAPGSAHVYVYVDPSKTWIGYMNVFDLPANGVVYEFGSAWGTADLDAVFSESTLTLTPNTSIDRDVPNDPYWWVGGAGGTPNKNMDAVMYVEDDTLAGKTVVFSGNCQQNTLTAPYTSVAFIRDFVSDYSSFTGTTVPVATGTAFSLSLDTAGAGPGQHVQYGFETIGPDARQATVSALGKVVINSSVLSPGAPTLNISQSGNTVTVYWQNVSGWTLQQNANLSLASGWGASGGVTTSNGTNYLNLTPPTGNLFFRLSNP